MLGGIGGELVFGAVVARLGAADAGLRDWLSQVVRHVVVRYSQLQRPDESAVEYQDLEIRKIDLHHMNDFLSDWYQQVLLLRQQENELF